jgi:hypothetical protein
VWAINEGRGVAAKVSRKGNMNQLNYTQDVRKSTIYWRFISGIDDYPLGDIE